MVRNLRRAPKLRDALAAANAADRFYAAMAGVAPRAQTAISPKRVYTKPNAEDTEAPVLAAVSELLHFHPRVLFAIRQNSGAAFDGTKPIWFYRIVKRPRDFTLTDFWGVTTDNLPWAIECKRPSWREPRTERELKQQAFIRIVQESGGIGAFVRSVEEAQKCLSQK